MPGTEREDGKAVGTTLLLLLMEHLSNLEALAKLVRTLEGEILNTLASPSWDVEMRILLNSKRFEDLLREYKKNMDQFGSSGTAMWAKLNALAKPYIKS